jgi:A/G-specific adenine glycosylase
MRVAEFRELVWDKARQLYRDMPWRDEPTFYHVLVSELMLQQTQVSRVIIKYTEFIKEFPTIQVLADASLADVLRVWTGLGYNRRAKYLHLAAKQVVERGEPTTFEGLVALPGVGKNTAGAIMNYVYNSATPFVETNIRTVYFHHFFVGATTVSDKELLELVAATIDPEHPREFCWALMDYGAELKAAGLARLSTSKHYKKQPPLAGSLREVRGQIVRLLASGPLTLDELETSVKTDERFERALSGLIADGLVKRQGTMICLTDDGVVGDNRNND